LRRRLSFGQLESSDEVQMSSQLRRRPERDPQTSDELLGGAQGVPLGHVRWDRQRGASNL